MEPRSLVKNASSPRQVARAESHIRRRAELTRAAFKAVLDTPAGRIVMWELLELAGVYRSVFNPSGSLTYYNAGRQDYGHELLAKLLEVDDQAYLLMESEARARERRDNATTDATHTPSVADEETRTDG